MMAKKHGFKIVVWGALFVAFIGHVVAQDVAVGHWRTHFASSEVRQLVQRDVDIFGLMETNLVYVDTRDDILYDMDRIDGLSGVGLSALAYEPLYDVLVVGYSNGLLDLVFGMDVVSLPYIQEADFDGDKAIYQIWTDGRYAYLATGFGVVVVDLRKAARKPDSMQMNYGLYALYLKCTKACALRYGRRNYDYQEGTIVSFAPGQVVQVDMMDEELQPEVYGLLFHPDLIHGTSLGKNIRRYSFFSYSSNEALHLSEQEKGIFLDGLRRIELELEHGSDRLSKTLISMNIELLLNYCMRFYERQFVTRDVPENDELSRFEQLLDEYFQSGKAERDGLPSVRYFADKICLSPNYFGDMIKKETGKSPQEHIQEKIIDLAKEQIMGTGGTISQIAYSLGFQYPQHLSRMFKKKVGCTPNEYRVRIQKA